METHFNSYGCTLEKQLSKDRINSRIISTINRINQSEIGAISSASDIAPILSLVWSLLVAKVVCEARGNIWEDSSNWCMSVGLSVCLRVCSAVISSVDCYLDSCDSTESHEMTIILIWNGFFPK